MTSKMTVKQPQPAMFSKENDQWSSGICDCCEDLPNCCLAFWCLPCFACCTSRDFGQCLCLPLLDFSGCVPPITLAMRVSMRERYGIKGSICRDCIFSCFCMSCTWCQMSREMKARNLRVVLVHSKNRA